MIPAGTQIRLYVAGDDIAGRTLHRRDAFKTRAAADVIVNGHVVVRKDADGEGTIGDPSYSGPNAADSIAMTFNWVSAVDGTKIQLAGNPAEAAGVKPDPWWVGDRLRAFGMAGVFRIVSAFTKDSVSVQTSSPAGSVK